MELDEQKAKDLDFMLLQMSKTTELLTTKIIKKKFFTDRDEEYCNRLYYILKTQAHHLLSIYETNEGDDLFTASDSVNPFLYEGGFTQLWKDSVLKMKEKIEIDELTKEKLKYDVKNAKRIYKTYWYTFWISIVGFLLAAGKIIYDLLCHNNNQV